MTVEEEKERENKKRKTMDGEQESNGKEREEKGGKRNEEEQKEEGNPTEKFSSPLERAVEVFKHRDDSRLRKACKILAGDNDEKFWAGACEYIKEWLGCEWDKGTFPKVVRPLFNLFMSRGKPDEVGEIFEQLFPIFQNKNLGGDPECIRLLKFIFEKLAITKGSKFCERWGEFLGKRNLRVENPAICDLIKLHSRKGTKERKNEWEQFQRNFTIPVITTETGTQHCIITTRTGDGERERKSFPRTIIIWNINGMNARWGTPNSEIKRLQHAVGADLLCFLESKITSEKLLGLQGFEEWVRENKFIKIFCLWSITEGKTPQGGEGILIFSKIPCTPTFGMGIQEFDYQARVVTLEFAEIIFIISYNPQGGVQTKSLDYRNRWETAFGKFLKEKTKEAREKNKGIIWGGDFNVNPLPDDWSERAFDNIRKKLISGEKPTGCRDIDRRVYEQMVEVVGGVDLGEIFAKKTGQGRKRTWFANEFGFRKNHGQRIDHIIAQRKFVDDSNKLQVKNFDVIQEFGGGRKSCSDHCPLWLEMEVRGEENENGEKTTCVKTTEKENPELQRSILEFTEKFMQTKDRRDKRPMSEEFFCDQEETFEENDTLTVLGSDNSQWKLETETSEEGAGGGAGGRVK